MNCWNGNMNCWNFCLSTRRTNHIWCDKILHSSEESGGEHTTVNLDQFYRIRLQYQLCDVYISKKIFICHWKFIKSIESNAELGVLFILLPDQEWHRFYSYLLFKTLKMHNVTVVILLKLICFSHRWNNTRFPMLSLLNFVICTPFLFCYIIVS